MSIQSIKICDVQEAKKCAGGYGGNNYTAWISTLDCEDGRDMYNIHRKFTQRGIPHFYRYFRDADDTCPYAETEGPQREDVEYIINFLTGLKNQDKNHHLGINCFAGIARSSSISLVAWVLCGFCEEVALDKVLAVRGCAWPNERILRLFDEITGKNTRQVVADWKKVPKHYSGIENLAWT